MFKEIRMLPGYKRFLIVKIFNDLLHRTNGGIIVIVNVPSNYNLTVLISVNSAHVLRTCI